MKQMLTGTMALVLLSMLSLQVAAQTGNSTAPWVSTNGYWVVESNKKSPKEALVHFYTNNNTLVYTKAIHNQRLKLHKTATLLQLKDMLEDAVAAYSNGLAARKNRRGTPLVQN